MMQPLFARMGGTYRQEGDYLIPNLAQPESTVDHLGKYGRMRLRFLKNHHPGIYTGLFLSGKLYEHLAEIDQTCIERVDRLILAMAKREGVTEALKATDQLEWVRRMNNIRNRAEELVYAELVYAE